mmetsp:Transcript_5602/g.11529  ORF Transcript_5602/g.11529 Transcript_5602/m.11529 type:complete len:137 (+) Transcript_5602:2460-2870(+)
MIIPCEEVMTVHSPVSILWVQRESPDVPPPTPIYRSPHSLSCQLAHTQTASATFATATKTTATSLAGNILSHSKSSGRVHSIPSSKVDHSQIPFPSPFDSYLHATTRFRCAVRQKWNNDGLPSQISFLSVTIANKP